MKTALIAGATGLVGSFLLDELLENDNYSQVKILVRKKMEKAHPKLTQIVFDYDNPDQSAVKADDVFCCLGTTIRKAGSKEAFEKVDYEYPLKLAQLAHKNGSKSFHLVTALGADEKSMFFYNKVKGKVEREVSKIPFDSLCIYRPSMLLGPRREFRLGEEVAKRFMKTFGFLFSRNTKGIHVSQVARCMVSNANEDQPEPIRVILSGEMQKFEVKKNV
ncbi:MAG: oxidoreductase [Bacteroidota bacterium]